MELIKETESKLKYGNLFAHAIFECPICKSHFEWAKFDVDSGRKKNCGCSRNLKPLDKVINGLKVLKDLGNIADNSGRKRRRATFECNFCANPFDKFVSQVKAKHGLLNCGCVKGKPKPACDFLNKYKPKKPKPKTLVEQCMDMLGVTEDEARKLYYTYGSMKRRCYTKTHHKYHIYGARGISVCDRWLNSFLFFCEDMGAKPSDDLSIDRIDNDGNYEPNNCRWATMLEQQNNKRNNIDSSNHT